jgi:hypothetical protein
VLRPCQEAFAPLLGATVADLMGAGCGEDLMGAGGRFPRRRAALRREVREAEPCADVIETNNRIVARE